MNLQPLIFCLLTPVSCLLSTGIRNWINGSKSSTTVENIRQIAPFYAKRTQFYAFFTEKLRYHEKTNPIRTQFEAKRTQFWPNIRGAKPKRTQTNPIPSRTSDLHLLLKWVNFGIIIKNIRLRIFQRRYKFQ